MAPVALEICSCRIGIEPGLTINDEINHRNVQVESLEVGGDGVAGVISAKDIETKDLSGMSLRQRLEQLGLEYSETKRGILIKIGESVAADGGILVGISSKEYQDILDLTKKGIKAYNMIYVSTRNFI
jgi:hypothetical protein